MDSCPAAAPRSSASACAASSAITRSTGDEWLETARTAHQLGLRSNCTMLYGHIENDEDRVDHLVKLRALQDETHGFVTFIPLAFHPDNTRCSTSKTTGFADIRNIAVARLMLDNIPHIKAYWVMMTPRMAQIALRFGADDIDGTIVEERIYHDAGATTSQGLRRANELLQPDPQGRPQPVERDTLYRPVERAETTFTVLDFQFRPIKGPEHHTVGLPGIFQIKLPRGKHKPPIAILSQKQRPHGDADLQLCVIERLQDSLAGLNLWAAYQ
jgi:aminodeoxyfutalosine synthase